MYEHLLRECPLCGKNDVHLAFVATEKGKEYLIECSNFDCIGCFTRTDKDVERLIRDWNYRTREIFELKSCPLCGGSAEIVNRIDENTGEMKYAVRCSDCNFTTSEITKTNEHGLYDVVSGWNKRTIRKKIFK